MRILMVTNNYSPYAGGVVSSINATVEALQKQGHQVTLVTLDFLGKAHADPAWVKRRQRPSGKFGAAGQRTPESRTPV